MIDQATIDRLWAAILKHGDTLKLDAVVDMLKALGLRLAVVVDEGAE